MATETIAISDPIDAVREYAHIMVLRCAVNDGKQATLTVTSMEGEVESAVVYSLAATSQVLELGPGKYRIKVEPLDGAVGDLLIMDGI